MQNLAAPLEEILLLPSFWELGISLRALQDLAFVVYIKIASGLNTFRVFFEPVLCLKLKLEFLVVNLIGLASLLSGICRIHQGLIRQEIKL